MDVVFDLLGHVVIDHILYVIDVQASARYISRDQHRTSATIFELLQELLSDLLRFVTVDAFDAAHSLLLAHLSHKVVHAFFRLAEDDRSWLR